MAVIKKSLKLHLLTTKGAGRRKRPYSMEIGEGDDMETEK